MFIQHFLLFLNADNYYRMEIVTGSTKRYKLRYRVLDHSISNISAQGIVSRRQIKFSMFFNIEISYNHPIFRTYKEFFK